MEYTLKKTWPDFWDFSEQIIAIEKKSFPSPWSARGFEVETEKDISNLWALVKEDNIIGYICFWLLDTEIHIINFAVKTEERKKGIGTILLRKIIDTGVSRGVQTVWLEVRPSNLPARAIYKKFGFIEAGKRVGYYSETGEDAIIMSLDLLR